MTTQGQGHYVAAAQKQSDAILTSLCLSGSSSRNRFCKIPMGLRQPGCRSTAHEMRHQKESRYVGLKAKEWAGGSSQIIVPVGNGSIVRVL